MTILQSNCACCAQTKRHESLTGTARPPLEFHTQSSAVRWELPPPHVRFYLQKFRFNTLIIRLADAHTHLIRRHVHGKKLPLVHQELWSNTLGLILHHHKLLHKNSNEAW
ncbi:hypothetical protein TRVL_10397 [Trypanosoma vivax]|nr:hypothetical protein TRVL_10397 [Trypanosoma vivax]